MKLFVVVTFEAYLTNKHNTPTIQKITGETPEVRSDKRKPREKKERKEREKKRDKRAK